MEPFIVDEIQFWDSNEPPSQIPSQLASRKPSADALERPVIEDEAGSELHTAPPQIYVEDS